MNTHRPSIHRISVAGALLLCLLGSLLPATASAQKHINADEIFPPGGDTVPVVLTISGGVSMGSYQSGVNWSLVEFFRATQDSAMQKRHPGLRPHALRVATGASAGNINALITGLEWCRAVSGPRPPEQSLFWQIWTTTGWEQLFPVSPSDTSAGYGLFHRRYFRDAHYPRIRRQLASDEQKPGCGVDLGITLTRLKPDTLELASGLTPVTQRVASIFRLRTGTDPGRRSIQFIQMDSSSRNVGTLGKLVLLNSGTSTVIPDSQVFTLVEASSAFPVAFAPVELRYRDPAGVQGNGDCRRDPLGDCLPPNRARFLDGGVFDNNPLGLALDLYRFIDPKFFGQPRVIYIDPDGLRARMSDLQGSGVDVEPSGRGVSSALQLLAGAIPSARQYELQTLVRTSNKLSRQYVSVTRRGHPVVGSRMGAFGAFLGKPFREYDFYAGVYDGLDYVSRYVLCADQADRDGCAQAQMRRFITENEVELGEVAPAVLAHLYQAEYGGAPVEVQPAEAARERVLVLLALAMAGDAELTRLARGETPKCGGPITSNMMCTSGFTQLMREFATPQVRDVIHRWGERPGCVHARYLRAATDCLADGTLIRLLDNPEVFMRNTVELALMRLSAIEHRLRKDGQPDQELALEAIAALYLASDGLTRQGLDMDPSSIPHKLGHLLHFFPYYVSNQFGAAGVEFGYRPTLHLRGRWYATAPVFPLHWGAADEDTRYRAFLGLGLGLMVEARRGSLFLEPSVQWVHAWRAIENRSRPVPTANLNVYLTNKLRLGVRWVAENDLDFQRGRNWTFSAGLADLNGLLFWTYRIAR